MAGTLVKAECPFSCTSRAKAGELDIKEIVITNNKPAHVLLTVKFQASKAHSILKLKRGKFTVWGVLA